ncbi:rhamnulokinase [Halarsenatibacter silvermanii]|uniref:Rhamnulokinase n=1 Tax=Halarsenatibacter silvermanii TaxID=321763 RepID=A0A1G9LZC4_9FIRM|nr:rhamnulokinase family protein [Halarsenatibacter silvermanii]SDL67306.1 rhamnulokinase [Halarsenatibacter silvermanii]
MNLLAFDLGSSNGRAMLGEYDGSRLKLKEVHRFTNETVNLRGELYWNAAGLFAEIKKGLLEALKESEGEIESLGISTWGVDYALLDGEGRLISNPYSYRDQRTKPIPDQVFAIMPHEEIYDRTGIQFMRLNTLYQLYAEKKKRGWALDAAERLLFLPDLFNYLLTGVKRAEETITSTSQLYDPRSRDWVSEIFERLELPGKLKEEIISPAQKLGNLSSEVAEELNLSQDISVTAVGGHDTASAVAGTPLEDPENSVFISSGSWSLLGMELNEPIINKASRKANFANEVGLAGTIRFLTNISGLWLIQECKRNWEKKGRNLSYEDISQKAAEAESFKFLLDPNRPRFLDRQDMPSTIRDYCRETEQPVPENYGEMARGIYESLALSYRHEIERLSELVDREPKNINIVGGGIKAEILSQLTADATGYRVVTGPVEATAAGNILAQLLARDELADLEEGRTLIENSFELTEYHPRSGEGWDEAYRRFRKLVNRD